MDPSNQAAYMLVARFDLKGPQDTAEFYNGQARENTEMRENALILKHGSERCRRKGNALSTGLELLITVAGSCHLYQHFE